MTDLAGSSDTETNFSYITTYTAPTADFVTDRTEALVDQGVGFTPFISGGKPSYALQWDFGDGNTETAATPTHSYTTSGTYTLSLQIWDSLGNQVTHTKTSYLTIYPALTVDFVADKSEALPNEEIAFTSTFSGGKPPYTYLWSWHDGIYSEVANTTRTYDAPGQYYVWFRVQDSLGDYLDKGDYITIYPALSAEFSADRREALVNQDIAFTGGAGGKSPHTYEWDFGDGATNGAANPTHAYGTAGTYTISLLVTDGLGNQVSQTRSSYITAIEALAWVTVHPDTVTQVETPDGRIAVEFPAGVVNTERDVIIRQQSASAVPSAPTGFKVGATAFSLDGVGDLTGEITITVKYSDEDVAAAGGDPQLLTLSRYDESTGEWVVLPTTVDTVAKTITATTNKASQWSVMAREAPAEQPAGGLPVWVWIIGGAVVIVLVVVVFLVRGKGRQPA